MNALLVFLVFSLPLHAESKPEKKLNLKPQHVSDSDDPGSATHLIYEAPKTPEKANAKGKITMGQTCTDQLGMVYKPGDTGYKGCIRTMDLTKPESTDQRKSVGITIGR
ncbi:MAG: hypothetical protein ACXWQO_04945 [Bdellovibrionota bacterium]